MSSRRQPPPNTVPAEPVEGEGGGGAGSAPLWPLEMRVPLCGERGGLGGWAALGVVLMGTTGWERMPQMPVG